MTFLLTGGIERKENVDYGEGRGFESAKLLLLNMNDKKQTELLVLNKGGENYPDEHPSLLFTCASLDGDTLWLTSETEVFEYSYPSLNLRRKISYPFFQNIHHVFPYGSSSIAVVSTGLDLVVVLSKATLEPISFFNVEGKDPWHRFDRSIDYRKTHSTKPHDSHPNFVFSLDDQLWVTRFKQKDAVNLHDPSDQIYIGGKGGVHDGHVIGQYIYFTSVFGEIVIADSASRKVVDRVNLNEIEGTKRPLGWCRGFCLDGDIAYVLFSRLRSTRIRENISWARDVVTGRLSITKSRVVAYNIKTREKVDEFLMPEGSINAMYSIIPNRGGEFD